MQLAVITDEISDDLGEALALAEQLEISAVEIRCVAGRNIVHHEPPSVRSIASTLRAGGFLCPVVDTPFLKTRLREIDWDELAHGFEVAHALGAGAIRVFSGLRDDPDASLEELTAILDEALVRAAAAALTLALEIEFVCSVATVDEAHAIIDRVTEPGLGLLWDPGNEARFLGSTPDIVGYDTVAGAIVHVHVKDVTAEGAWTTVGRGIAGWDAQLERLAATGYDGYLSLETHYADAVGGPPAATRESASALRELLDRAGAMAS